MRKGFSLMELIIAVIILSFVIITLFKIKSNNINLLKKSDEQSKYIDLLLAGVDLDDNSKKENKIVYLDKLYRFNNDNIRKELKEIKIKIKAKLDEKKVLDIGDSAIKINIYKRSYEIKSHIKRSLNTFKVSF